jgi:hypothetical protein
MPKQPELFERPLLSVNPPRGVDQPALWVRRLTIWKEPGVAVRTVELRPGLNFIWSPDPADSGGSGDAGELGHGAGKTLFCRLLRYCLGEQRFAPDDQHLSISAMFLHGWVSAEVMVMGTPWGVLRPLGVGRGHFAVKGVLPEQLFERLNEPTGMAPLLNAIEKKVLTAKVASLIPASHPHDAWRITLAWLTRDQECRFDHVLDWRSADSDSESPTRSMSRGRLQDALRVLIGAISPEEMDLQNAVAVQSEAHKTKVEDVERQRLACEKLRREIIPAVGLTLSDVPDGRLCIDMLRQAARRQLAQAAKVNSSVDVSNLDELRQRWRDAGQGVAELEKQQAVYEARLPIYEALHTQLQSELPLSSVRVRDAELPTCQICEVPIDLVLVQGCKLSHKLPDVDALRQRHTALTKQVLEAQVTIAEVKQKVTATKQQLPPSRTERDTLLQALRKAEKLNETRSSTWFKVTKSLDDIKRLEREWGDWEQAQTDAARLAAQLDEKRGRVGAFREQQGDAFDRLSIYFDAVICTVVGPTASGRVTLDGNGLKLIVQLGGERSTAAIESLKVISFDIAVMCMSMQGVTHLPAFLVHDSPREADLGLSVYHRFFSMVAALEGQQGHSVFQYIVTTTTQPPAEFQKQPWLRLELRGSPSTERLLGCDLP